LHLLQTRAVVDELVLGHAQLFQNTFQFRDAAAEQLAMVATVRGVALEGRKTLKR
jgi:hypothetical protein